MGIALSFASGLAQGTAQGLRQKELDRQANEDRLMRQQEHDARMAEIDRANQDRAALANAAKPVTVDNGATVTGLSSAPTLYDSADVASSDVRQNNMLADRGMPGQQDASGAPLAPDSSLGGDPTAPDAGSAQPALARATVQPTPVVQGKAFADPAAASAAAAAANTPQARDARIAQAQRERGNVNSAMQYEASSRQAQLSGMQLADKVWNQKIRTAMEGGHQGLADLVSQSQGGALAQHQLQAVPSADGKSVTYNKVGDDGTLTPLPNLTFSNDQNGVIRAAYMLDSSVDPQTRYENMLKEDKQTATLASKEQELLLKQRELEEVKVPNADTRAQLADVKKRLADIQANRGDSSVAHENRMRWTTLFNDSGRRMRDVQQTINQLQRSPTFMAKARKPDSDEAQQMKSLQDELVSHRQERDTYQKLLAGSQVQPATAPAAAPGAASSGPVDLAGAAAAGAAPGTTKVPPQAQAARDADSVKILQDELGKAQQRLATGDSRAQGDIDGINREIQRTQATLSKATPKNGLPPAPAVQPAPAAVPSAVRTGGTRDNPVKVGSAAERNALPKGAYYTAPNGQTYVKQ